MKYIMLQKMVKQQLNNGMEAVLQSMAFPQMILIPLQRLRQMRMVIQPALQMQVLLKMVRLPEKLRQIRMSAIQIQKMQHLRWVS